MLSEEEDAASPGGNSNLTLSPSGNTRPRPAVSNHQHSSLTPPGRSREGAWQVQTLVLSEEEDTASPSGARAPLFEDDDAEEEVKPYTVNHFLLLSWTTFFVLP